METEGDELEDGGGTGDQVIMINGGGGQIEIRDGANLLMQGTMISKKNRIQNNAEETKINFFDPNAFGGKGANGDDDEEP